MEQLTEKVYECNLAVEAHMVCDLLSQAGISARVDGEFLQSAAGEIPLGNTVKVRVDPSRAAEAREVIADWEKLQPPPDPVAAPAANRSPFASPLWFCFGAIVGAVALFAWMRSSQADSGGYDRNHDGRVDARWFGGWDGAAERYEEDRDFDGRFEWQMELDDDGNFKRSMLDTDLDGRPEQVWYFLYGIVQSIDYHFASGGRVVKREHYRAGLLSSAEFDDDGDGRFERRVEYDSHGDPEL